MEAKLRALFFERGLIGRVRLASAGIQGTHHTSPPRFMTLAEYPEGAIMLPMLREKGIDVSAHRYQPVTRVLVREAALILVPSEDIRSGRPNAMIRQFPFCKGKTKLFSELIGKKEDVPDFGDSFDEKIHRQSLEMICLFAEQGFTQLCVLASIVCDGTFTEE